MGQLGPIGVVIGPDCNLRLLADRIVPRLQVLEWIATLRWEALPIANAVSVSLVGVSSASDRGLRHVYLLPSHLDLNVSLSHFLCYLVH